MSEWQPISTAPRDGTSFIAAVQVRHWNRSRDDFDLYWDRHIIRFDPDAGEIDPDTHQGWELDDYTHWMPLPAPPESDGA